MQLLRRAFEGPDVYDEVQISKVVKFANISHARFWFVPPNRPSRYYCNRLRWLALIFRIAAYRGRLHCDWRTRRKTTFRDRQLFRAEVPEGYTGRYNSDSVCCENLRTRGEPWHVGRQSFIMRFVRLSLFIFFFFLYIFTFYNASYYYVPRRLLPVHSARRWASTYYNVVVIIRIFFFSFFSPMNFAVTRGAASYALIFTTAAAYFKSFSGNKIILIFYTYT